MLRSRMFTTAFRFFAGLAIASLVAAFLVGFTSEIQTPMDRILGPLTLGWKGGVGNHFAYAFFVGLFAVSAGPRRRPHRLPRRRPRGRGPGRPDRQRAAHPGARRQQLPARPRRLRLRARPGRPGHRAATCLVGGGAGRDASPSAFTWTLRTWAERATGDDPINAELYHRFIDPLRTPVVAIVLHRPRGRRPLPGAAGASPRPARSSSSARVATLFFVVAAILALYPKSTKTVTTILVVFGALAILVAGIIGAFVGERDIEHHGDEQEQEAPAASRGRRSRRHGRPAGAGGQRMTTIRIPADGPRPITSLGWRVRRSLGDTSTSSRIAASPPPPAPRP